MFLSEHTYYLCFCQHNGYRDFVFKTYQSFIKKRGTTEKVNNGRHHLKSFKVGQYDGKMYFIKLLTPYMPHHRLKNQSISINVYRTFIF